MVRSVLTLILLNKKLKNPSLLLTFKSREWDGFNPELFLIFSNSTVLPILDYATGVWGTGTWASLDELHLKACKSILGVKGSTTPFGLMQNEVVVLCMTIDILIS